MRKVMIWTAVLVSALVVITGCTPSEKKAVVKAPEAPTVDLALKFADGQTAVYKVGMETWRTAKFEGPELSKEPKLKSGRTGQELQMVCAQEIASVHADGSAVAKITIKELKYSSEATSEVTNTFDSTNEADKAKPFAKLIGQTYTMKLMPDGKAEVVDFAALRSAITEGSAKDLVAGLFSDKELAKLHTVEALPESATQKVGSTWSRIEPSPRGMMDAKNFEKVYTLMGVDNGVAVVEMKAVPSTKPLDSTEMNSQAMMTSMFKNMMESKDNFTGKLLLGTDGTLNSYVETLDAQWFATDPAAKSGTEPDKITMGFLQKHSIKKVD